MAQETCLFRDGPHTCGEPAVNVVAIAPNGAASATVPVCTRHEETLRTMAGSVSSAPAAVSEAPADGTPGIAAPVVQISAGDTVGAGERT